MQAAVTARSTTPAPLLKLVDDVRSGFPAEKLEEPFRLDGLRTVMGERPLEAKVFADAIRARCRVLWDLHVAPLVDQHWPEAHQGRDEKKIRFLTVNLYAAAPFTVVFCAKNPPFVVKLASTIGKGLGLSVPMLHKGGALAMSVFSRTFPAMEQRRIVLIAAFIAAVDHAFDHYMDGVPPLEREARIKGLLDGTWEPDTAPFKLVRAIRVAMAEGIPDDEKPHFDAAMDRVKEWVEAEVCGMTGIEDPKGLGWRLAGVEGTIDGLIFPVHKYAGENGRQWMYDVSLYTQMMDDWIDYEADKADIRTTPVITGMWTLSDIQKKWEETIAGVEGLARESGLDTPKTQAFVRDVYVYMMHDVMHAMIHGVAA
jgi:hypothetical protein